LFAAGLGGLAHAVRADYNPERKGFYRPIRRLRDWANAFLAEREMGIMVFGRPRNETVIYNDRGFNLAKPRIVLSRK